MFLAACLLFSEGVATPRASLALELGASRRCAALERNTCCRFAASGAARVSYCTERELSGKIEIPMKSVPKIHEKTALQTSPWKPHGYLVCASHARDNREGAMVNFERGFFQGLFFFHRFWAPSAMREERRSLALPCEPAPCCA